jgi:hypothetical protein
MKKIFYLIFFAGFFISLLILGCGSHSSPPASQPIGSDIIKQYNFHIESGPTTTTITLPQEFSGPDWGLKETICEQAGYSLVPYAGQSVTLAQYNVEEKYYLPTTPELPGEPLYLWIVAKDQTSICGYLTVREGTNLASGVCALNDPNIR